MALNIPCPVRPDCIEETPLANLTSEAPDAEVFISVYFPPVEPPLARQYTGTGCGVSCTADSQEAANLCAQQLAQQCVNEPPPVAPPPPSPPPGGGGGGGPFDPPEPPPPPPPPPVTPCNVAQTCCYTCPDGTEFCFTTPACTYYAATQAEANAIAYAYACQQAQLRAVCMSGTSDGGCVAEELGFVIHVDGGTAPFTWSIISGALPFGFSGTVQSDSRNFEVGGIGLTPGNTDIVVRATDSLGNFMQKTFTLMVVGITSAEPPDAEVGVAYSFQFTAEGGIQPYNWSLLAGSLPSGLTLSQSGLLSGTPTTAQTGVQFTVAVKDSSFVS